MLVDLFGVFTRLQSRFSVSTHFFRRKNFSKNKSEKKKEIDGNSSSRSRAGRKKSMKIIFSRFLVELFSFGKNATKKKQTMGTPRLFILRPFQFHQNDFTQPTSRLGPELFLVGTILGSFRFE